MSNIQTASAIEAALISGDLSKLTTDQRVSYYNNLCSSLGLNPLTRPFEYLILNGKLTLYARKDCTDQLRTIKKVSIKIADTKQVGDIYLVVTEASDSTGRVDSATGAVNIQGLKGDNLANAFMKAETKAKRRVTLSLCGLGLLDESEVDSISDAKKIDESQAQQNVSAIKDVMKETNFTKPEEPKAEVKKVTPEVMKDENELGNYCAKFGKFENVKLSDIKDFELESYLIFLRNSPAKSGKPLSNNAQEMLEIATKYRESISAKAPQFNHDEEMPF